MIDIEKLIEQLRTESLYADLFAIQAENEKLRAELDRVKQCIEIIEKQRDSAIEELENYMV